MSDTAQIILAIVVGLPATLGAIASVIGALASLRSARQSKTNHTLMTDIKAQTDGMVEAGLVRAQATGNAIGTLEERDRADAASSLK